MNRIIAPILSLALAGTAFAAGSDTHRYLIETRRSAAALRMPADLEAPRYEERLANLDVVIADLTEDEAAAMRHSRQIRRIEPDHAVKALGLSVAPTLSSHRTSQSIPYGIDLVRAPMVWSAGSGARIKLGIIDTGIDRTHPDLKDNYKGGFDFVANDDDPTDENGHGTHVAGTIGAINNGIGVVGVAPNVEIYSLRVLDAKGSGSLSNIMKALNWAIDNKLNIVSLSLGSSDSSDIEKAAFQKVADAGILAIAASGNDYDTLQADGLSFPAGYPTVLSVGAIDKASAVATFSQRGPDLKIVAPGVAVLSTYPVGKAVFTAVEVEDGTAFTTSPMTGSPTTNISGEFVFCELGKKTDFPASVAGKIALIKRGEITFAEKAKNALAAGAKAVIVYNKEPGGFGGTLLSTPPTPEELAFAWPAVVSMSQEDGEALKALGGKQISLKFGETDDYEELQGTSMATPHVSGVAALIWSLAPNATAAQVADAMLSTARDLGNAGFDNVFGFGAVDAYAAARRLAPAKFPSPPRHRSVKH